MTADHALFDREMQVPCPGQRQKSVVTLQMTTRNGMLYEVRPALFSCSVFLRRPSHCGVCQDSFVLSFHMHFFRTLKVFVV